MARLRWSDRVIYRHNTTTKGEPMIDSQSQTELKTSATTSSRPSPTARRLLDICATSLFFCFFLPWVNLLLVKPSGFDLAKAGGAWVLIWALPAFCLVTVLAGLSQQKWHKPAAVVTGFIPFVILFIGLFNHGEDLIQQLRPATHVGFFVGLVLIFLPTTE